MGFGYLLIGYIIAFVFSVSSVYFFADIIGGAVMMLAFSKLAQFQKNFLRAMWADIGYVAVCFVRAVLTMLRLTDGEGIIGTVLSVLVLLASLVLHFFMLAGIHYLAKDVGLEKESRRARSNIVMIVTYYPLYGISYFLTPYLGDTLRGIVALVITLYGVAVIFLNALLIYSCFCGMCISGQETGERTPSRLPWLDKVNTKVDSVLDSAFSPAQHKKEEKKDAVQPEPGYLRVKRKKKKK